MPLVTTGHTMTLVGSEPWSVALFMQVDGSDPAKTVRVTATPECLASLDPKGIVDKVSALDVAMGDRMRIESAASKKFDNEGLNSNGELVLGARDLP